MFYEFYNVLYVPAKLKYQEAGHGDDYNKGRKHK